MTETVTITFSSDEYQQLLRGLVALRESHANIEELMPSIGQLLLKLARAPSDPTITIGVHGGQVQWVLGNAFPIRVCDYDGETDELPDLDERDQKCRIWFEPVDNNWAKEYWTRRPRFAKSA